MSEIKYKDVMSIPKSSSDCVTAGRRTVRSLESKKAVGARQAKKAMGARQAMHLMSASATELKRPNGRRRGRGGIFARDATSLSRERSRLRH